MQKHTNKLINETSPYLLQHAHNPVNWYPWGDEALHKAKTEDKPILVSIGYAACHWCHVMEKESFEDEATASIMNDHFINIKIDREERPDLDHIYMDALQAMTGSGGWPLNVFLTPDKKPFYGGTYFPPRRAFNRSSWTEVLLAVADAFQNKRKEINEQAENLVSHIAQSGSFSFSPDADRQQYPFTMDKAHLAFENIMKAADKEWGGFGRAPKFPQTFTIQFLLRYYFLTKNAEALQQATHSLDKMIEGGIYDQLGGGFSRYSTDAEWLAPHFEKMLYDNALLLTTLSEAYKVIKKERYKEIITETIEFVKRELYHPEGGFYAALDADSEGEEGKFYVWDKREIEEVLGADAELFCKYYDVTNHGNWEGTNILRVKKEITLFASENNIIEYELEELLKKNRKALLAHRDKRIRPLLDDKIILGWNGLMNVALASAYEATGNEEYMKMAITNMQFLLNRFHSNDGQEFYHTWKNGVAKYPAFLDDYAFLIQALIRLSEVTGDTKWLIRARDIAEYVLKSFSEPGSGFFYFTNETQKDVIIRKKEVYDGAVASGNSEMAGNLHRLSVFFNLPGWKERAYKMIATIRDTAIKYPASFGVWNNLMLELSVGTNEIAIIGKGAEGLQKELLSQFLPFRAIMTFEKGDENFSMAESKPITDPASIYLCRDYVCQAPVHTISALMLLIDRGAMNK